MKHLLCLGDSITDSNRLWENYPLGNGYVSMLSRKFHQNHINMQITNCGTDGFTLSRLLEKAPQQYASYNADIITILIGINDIGLMMNTRRSFLQKRKMMESFMHNYEELLNILSSGAHSPYIILMEPFIFPYPEELKLWIPYVQEMGQEIRSLAQKLNHPFLPLQKELNQKTESTGYSSVTTDGVHLTTLGHEIISDKLMPLLIRGYL